ncbi:MAG: sigma-70 family RNA polymerase sigma factor [Terriglobia bacterium]
MDLPSKGDITHLLLAWSGGDREAFNKLASLVYPELKRIARSKLRQHGADGLLQPTVLVHEAYLKLVDQACVQWRNRAHFYAIAANTIRRILIDDYRQRIADKRGGGASLMSLDENDAIAHTPSIDLLALNEAFDKLVTLDHRQAEIIEMRFFGGMTHGEIAEVSGISKATVERELRAAKAWLRFHLADG